MRNLLSRSNRAQGMVEYIIIVVVVGIFCIGIFMALGRGVQEQVGHSTEKLVGAKTHNAKIAPKQTTDAVKAETSRKGGMSHE